MHWLSEAQSVMERDASREVLATSRAQVGRQPGSAFVHDFVVFQAKIGRSTGAVMFIHRRVVRACQYQRALLTSPSWESSIGLSLPAARLIWTPKAGEGPDVRFPG